MLWIGFKILYLCGLKQLANVKTICETSCELVSKFCIFVVWNSLFANISFILSVVNWFQNFVSLWSETVSKCHANISKQLWIGFKILYLCGLKQFKKCTDVGLAVVNWFQNFVSLWSETVGTWKNGLNHRLWIGFKILYLCGLKQFCKKVRVSLCGCELVSKFCIFVVWNSK